MLQKYLEKVKDSLFGLSKFKIKHIQSEENGGAHLLSKLASTKPIGNARSVIEETRPYPCVILQVEDDDWRTPLKEYI